MGGTPVPMLVPTLIATRSRKFSNLAGAEARHPVASVTETQLTLNDLHFPLPPDGFGHRHGLLPRWLSVDIDTQVFQLQIFVNTVTRPFAPEP